MARKAKTASMTAESQAIVPTVAAPPSKPEPDGFAVANSRLDSLYQEIEETETDPRKKLSSLCQTLNMKIRLSSLRRMMEE